MLYWKVTIMPTTSPVAGWPTQVPVSSAPVCLNVQVRLAASFSTVDVSAHVPEMSTPGAALASTTALMTGGPLNATVAIAAAGPG